MNLAGILMRCFCCRDNSSSSSESSESESSSSSSSSESESSSSSSSESESSSSSSSESSIDVVSNLCCDPPVAPKRWKFAWNVTPAANFNVTHVCNMRPELKEITLDFNSSPFAFNQWQSADLEQRWTYVNYIIGYECRTLTTPFVALRLDPNSCTYRLGFNFGKTDDATSYHETVASKAARNGNCLLPITLDIYQSAEKFYADHMPDTITITPA